MELEKQNEELRQNRFIAEEWFLIMLNRNFLTKMNQYLDPEVEFPGGTGDKECLEWLRKELDIIEKYRNSNGGKINGKIFDPRFDEKGEPVEFYISTGPNAGNRAIPIQDFAFPFRKDFDRPRAITLSFNGPLISKIEITFDFVEYSKFEEMMRCN